MDIAKLVERKFGWLVWKHGQKPVNASTAKRYLKSRKSNFSGRTDYPYKELYSALHCALTSPGDRFTLEF